MRVLDGSNLYWRDASYARTASRSAGGTDGSFVRCAGHQPTPYRSSAVQSYNPKPPCHTVTRFQLGAALVDLAETAEPAAVYTDPQTGDRSRKLIVDEAQWQQKRSEWQGLNLSPRLMAELRNPEGNPGCLDGRS